MYIYSFIRYRSAPWEWKNHYANYHYAVFTLIWNDRICSRGRCCPGQAAPPFTSCTHQMTVMPTQRQAWAFKSSRSRCVVPFLYIKIFHFCTYGYCMIWIFPWATEYYGIHVQIQLLNINCTCENDPCFGARINIHVVVTFATCYANIYSCINVYIVLILSLKAVWTWFYMFFGRFSCTFLNDTAVLYMKNVFIQGSGVDVYL